MPLGLMPGHLGSRGCGKESAEQEVLVWGGEPRVCLGSLGWLGVLCLSDSSQPLLSFLLGPGNCLCLLPCEEYPKWLRSDVESVVSSAPRLGERCSILHIFQLNGLFFQTEKTVLISDTLSLFSLHPCSCTLGPCSICTPRKERPFWGVFGKGVGWAGLALEVGIGRRLQPAAFPVSQFCAARLSAAAVMKPSPAEIKDSTQRTYLGGTSPHLPRTSSPRASVQLWAWQLPSPPRGLAPFRVVMSCSDDTFVISAIFLDLVDNREFKCVLPCFSMETTQPGLDPSSPPFLAPKKSI